MARYKRKTFVVRQLPCAPSPTDGEGFLGYRLRLAEANKYPNSNWLYGGPVANTLLLGAENYVRSDPIERLAGLTDIDSQELARKLLFPRRLCFRSLNVHMPRVCPTCLEEGLYLRRLWDLSLIVVCPLHGTYMLRNCPQCNSPLRWSRAQVAICDCGFDFRTAKMPTVDRAITDLTRRLALVAEDVGTTEYFRQLPLNFNDSFPDLDLPLDELCTLIMFVGGLSIHGAGGKAFMQPRLIDMQYAVSLVDHASQSLQSWPDNFHRSLQRMMEARERKDHSGINQRFGYMYTYMYVCLRSHHFDFLRERFEMHLRDNYVGIIDTKRVSRVSSDICTQARYVSAKTAAKELNTGAVRIKEFIEAGELCGVIQRDKSNRKLAFVERSDLERFAALRRDLVNLTVARKLLGINHKTQALELLRAEPFKTTIACSKGNNHWEISKKKIELLVSSLTGDLPPITTPLKSDLRTLRHLVRFTITSKGAFPSLIRAVLDKKISPVGRVSKIPGIGGIVFRVSDVFSFGKQLQGVNEYLSVQECATHLHVVAHTFYKLMNTGLLKYRTVRIGFRTQRLVRLTDLNEFRERYITASEVAELTGMSRKHLHLALEQNGIKPIHARLSQGSNLNVYLRRAVLKRFA